MNNILRMCASCRQKKLKHNLVRIANCDGKPVIDQDKKQNSRGLYVCYDDKCVDILFKSKAISRSLKIEEDKEFINYLKEFIKNK